MVILNYNILLGGDVMIDILIDGIHQQMRWGDVCRLGAKGIVLYFYPKDNTPGCTIESQGFSSHQQRFADAGYGVVGVSKDTVDSHRKFVDKCSLSIPLISDTSLVLHKKFSTLGEKKMFGKTYQGTIRSTFVLDGDGIVLYEWRKVRVKDHVASVIKAILS